MARKHHRRRHRIRKHHKRIGIYVSKKLRRALRKRYIKI